MNDKGLIQSRTQQPKMKMRALPWGMQICQEVHGHIQAEKHREQLI